MVLPSALFFKLLTATQPVRLDLRFQHLSRSCCGLQEGDALGQLSRPEPPDEEPRRCHPLRAPEGHGHFDPPVAEGPNGGHCEEGARGSRRAQGFQGPRGEQVNARAGKKDLALTGTLSGKLPYLAFVFGLEFVVFWTGNQENSNGKGFFSRSSS